MKKKILFVDDEPNILSGLKRMLRSQRNEWDMSFAEGGEAAIELIKAGAFDAVITDMRMPGMDGAQLLEEVKRLHPESVRFVLSGYSDQALVMRSVGPSHQYLSKPCEPEVLISALADAFALRELLSSEALRSLVAGMTSLPSLPTLYKSLVEALQSDDVCIKDIGDIIEQDPGMSAKLLQLVNSAYFGLGRHIASPTEATSFLGMDVIKGLVLSQGIFSQFDENMVKALSLDKQRATSLQVSNYARNIARLEEVNQVVVDQAFLGGILHDIGTLVLAANVPEEYMRAYKLAQQEDMSIWEAEEKIFSTTHAEVGAYMLGLWGIDDDVVASVAYHHYPARYSSTKFSPVTAVYVANLAAGAVESGDAWKLTEIIDHDYINKLGLSDRVDEWQTMCVPAKEDAA